MIVKRKLYSVMDEEGNMGYYLYNASTGEEKLFSVVEEEERLYARGVGMAVQQATKMAQSKGMGAVNKALGRESLIKSTRNLKPKFANLPDNRVLKSARSTNKPIVPQKGNFNAPKGLHEKITQRGNYISDFQRNSGVNHPLMKDHPGMISDPTFNLVKLR